MDGVAVRCVAWAFSSLVESALSLTPKRTHKHKHNHNTTTTKNHQVPDLKVTIVSSDKDFLQLVTEDVSVFDPFNMARLGPNEVFEKYGVSEYLHITHSSA